MSVKAAINVFDRIGRLIHAYTGGQRIPDGPQLNGKRIGAAQRIPPPAPPPSRTLSALRLHQEITNAINQLCFDMHKTYAGSQFSTASSSPKKSCRSAFSGVKSRMIWCSHAFAEIQSFGDCLDGHCCTQYHHRRFMPGLILCFAKAMESFAIRCTCLYTISDPPEIEKRRRPTPALETYTIARQFHRVRK